MSDDFEELDRYVYDDERENAALNRMGAIAREAHEKAASLPDGERWNYVAASVLLAFGKHVDGVVARRPVSRVVPALRALLLVLLVITLMTVAARAAWGSP